MNNNYSVLPDAEIDCRTNYPCRVCNLPVLPYQDQRMTDSGRERAHAWCVATSATVRSSN